jgi:hypothetical protein
MFKKKMELRKLLLVMNSPLKTLLKALLNEPDIVQIPLVSFIKKIKNLKKRILF